MLFMLDRPSRLLPWATAALGLLVSPNASAISGVCPDGSVFIVQRAADIPCKQARRVEPSQVPPLRPENLPTPYLWQVYREKQNENNPYNLIERAERVRGGLAQGAAPEAAPSAPQAEPGASRLPQVAAAPPTTPAPPAPPAKTDLGNAVRYLLGQQERLARCIMIVDAELSNNAVERAVRPLKLGAKNWLFIGHPNAGPRLANLFTLVENCRLLGIDPERYLIDVITRLPDHSAAKIAELLPHHWQGGRGPAVSTD